TGDVAQSDDDLDDTIPPGSLDVSDIQDEASLDDDSTSDGLDDIEFGDVEESVPDATQPVETATDTVQSDEPQSEEPEVDAMDMGDLEWPSFEETDETTPAEDGEAAVESGISDEPTIVEDNLSANLSEELPGFDEEEKGEPAVETATDEEGSKDSSGADETDGLDFDLSGLELPDENDTASEEESESDSLLQETGETVEASGSDSSDEPAEKMDLDDFDLSDLDLSGESSDDSPVAVEEPQKEELQTADLDKTVVMDWSKETLTSGDHEVGGESGAGDIEFDTDDAAEEPAVEAVDAGADAAESSAEVDEPEEHLSSVEFDLENLDVDLDGPVDSDDMDDFSSTIQTSLEEIRGDGKPDASDKADKDDSDESDGISAEDIDGSLDRLQDDNSSIEELIENSDDKDFDATMELDSLLSELSLDEDDEEKKDS
ncbi:MAG TPA: hypothetical protein VKA23_01420, partial [Mariprofundaceae bacterium]|nr:hypothetical protein [Mariprofundaceae bacterium]